MAAGHKAQCVFCVDSPAATRACPHCVTLLACLSCAKIPQIRSINKCPLCHADLVPISSKL